MKSQLETLLDRLDATEFLTSAMPPPYHDGEKAIAVLVALTDRVLAIEAREQLRRDIAERLAVPRGTLRDDPVDLSKIVHDHLAVDVSKGPRVTFEPHHVPVLKPDGSVEVRSGRCGTCKWRGFAACEQPRVSREFAEGPFITDASFGCLFWERATEERKP